MATAPATRAPWHLWAVGLLGLAWNSFGVFDYIKTKTGGEQYLRDFGMNDAQIAYMAQMPAWTTAAWAVGVFGALGGTLLLVLRSRHAVAVFAVSLAAFLASLVHAYFLSDGARLMGQQGMIMNVVIFAGCVFFLLYARAMAKRGVLR